MKVAFFTLGCKVNQYESQFLMQQFKKNGFEVVASEEIADVYIINSCTVTSTGDKKTRQIIHRLKTLNQNALIVLTGCFPQAFPEEAKKISEADIITGTKNRKEIYNLVIDKLGNNLKNEERVHIYDNEKDKTFEAMSVEKFDGKTRAFMKIQDGCNRFCSYCIIPKARGRVRSKSLNDIKHEAEQLALNGHKEIVFTGINLSSYGQDLENVRLVDAVEVIAKIDGIKRVRFSSLEPELLTIDDVKRLKLIDEFCPHFHLCLQSGCNATLKRMNRHYTTDVYYESVLSLRRHFDDPAITTDVIAGFPGETDEEFEQTAAFLKKVAFSDMHIFKFSPRKNTKAAVMDGQISEEVKNTRSDILLDMALGFTHDYMTRHVGRSEEILIEEEKSIFGKKYMLGHTPDYILVAIPSYGPEPGDIVKVKLTGILTEEIMTAETE